MKKRGMLLAEETLKTVIAVIAIGFLLFFLTSLYFSNQQDAKKIDAEKTLDRISLVLENLNESSTVPAIEPEGWTLFNYTQGTKPNQCVGVSCICLCDDVIDVLDRQLKTCSEEGVCLKINNLQPFEPIEIVDIADSITNIEIKKEEEKIFISQVK